MSNPTALSTAVRLCELGIRVFPMPWASKSPFAGDSWPKTATNNPAEAVSRLNQCPDQHNLSIVLGPASGILDIEMDNDEGNETWQTLTTVFGAVPTIAWQSRRGCHHLFQWDPLIHDAIGDPDKSVIKIRGLEIRLGSNSKGAYSVVPPSKNPDDGVFYRWLPGCSPWEVSVAPLPLWFRSWVLPLAQAKRDKFSSARTQDLENVDGDYLPGPGSRHEYALHLSQHLYCRLRMPKPLVTSIVKAMYRITHKTGPEAERDAEVLVNSLQRPPSDEEVMASLDWIDADRSAEQMLRNLKAVRDEEEGRTDCPAVFPELFERIGNLSRDCQIPRNLVMLNQLVAVSAAVGSSVTMQYSVDAPVTGLQLYGMGCGDSGSGKSLSLRGPLSPLSDSRAMCTDATPESLAAYLGRHPRGVLLRLSEGKQFTAMLGRYRGSGSENATSNNSLFCEAWSGDPIVAIRQDEKKSLRIDRPFLSIAAVIQPYNLRTFSVDDVMDGLLQRLLIVGADEVPDDPIPGAAAANTILQPEYTHLIHRLRSLRPRVYDQAIEQQCATDWELWTNCRPVALVLDSEAEARWKGYQRWKRSPLVQNYWAEGHPFRADLHRHAEMVLRVAGCLFMAAWASSDGSWAIADFSKKTSQWVPVFYVEKAIQFVEWAWSEKRRVAETMVEEKFLKAVPTGVSTRLAGIPEMMRRLAAQRYRMITSRLKGGDQWTRRDYCRLIRISVDEAEAEIQAFTSHQLLQGVAGTNPQKYRFIPEQIHPNGRR